MDIPYEKMTYKSSTTGRVYKLFMGQELWAIEALDKSGERIDYEYWTIEPNTSMMWLGTDFLKRVQHHLNTNKFNY